MTPPAVNTVTPAEAERTLAVLTLAFATDPVIRTLLPEPVDYLRVFPEIARINLGYALETQTAFYIEDFAGAAIWIPPALTDEARRRESERQSRLNAVIGGLKGLEEKTDFLATVSDVRASHPTAPHWYLFAIGVDPRCQSQGLGALLMKHVLPRCDTERHFAYLESSTLRNVPFYKRHGFETLREAQVGSAPLITLMVRPPRS